MGGRCVERVLRAGGVAPFVGTDCCLQGSLKVDLEVAHEAQADFFQAYEYARQQVWTGAVFLAVWG